MSKIPEISWDAIHLERKFGIFGLESNGTVIFGSFISKILGNLSRLTIFSKMSGYRESSLLFDGWKFRKFELEFLSKWIAPIILHLDYSVPGLVVADKK